MMRCSYIECYEEAEFQVLAGESRRVVCNAHVDKLVKVIEDHKADGLFKGPVTVLLLAAKEKV